MNSRKNLVKLCNYTKDTALPFVRYGSIMKIKLFKPCIVVKRPF